MGAPEHLLVHTTSGPVLGFEDTYPLSDRSTAALTASGKQGGHPPVNKWLGIPYAQAARWKRPTAPASWKEPLDCHEFGPHFPQPPDGAVMLYLGKKGCLPRAWTEQSEEKGFNCNVFAPEGILPDEKLPVLVWIYGGALLYGRSSICIYDPTEWIRRESVEGRRFIVVTGNYRVNVFGFLSSSELTEEDENGLSGNYGLYDCIAYLQWVQDNISKFGGDPDNVTVFGESAGGAIIANLLIYEKKLYKNAILQSGFSGTMSFQDAKAADSTYEAICEKAVKEVTPGPNRLAALRALSATQLLECLPPFPSSSFTVESSPKAVWDSASIIQKFKQGKWNPHIKSVMVGVTKDEGSLFTLLLQTHKPSGYDFLFEVMVTKTSREQVDKCYTPSFSDKSSGPPDFTQCAGADVIADCTFIVPMEVCANVLSSTTHGETQEGVSVYMYQLNATVHAIEDGRGLGAFHSVDIPFIFNLKEAWSEDSTNAKTSALMGESWYNFAKSGCPDLTWPQYNPAAPFRRVFEADGTSTVEDIGVKSDIEKSRYELWAQYC